MPDSAPLHILLLEPEHLLRRTVALTVRSLGSAEITEAATYPVAQGLCARRGFDGAVIALDWPLTQEQHRGLTLVQQIRAGDTACRPSMPIAVLVESCTAETIGLLRSCGVSRILIKPFRVRDVIDTIDAMRVGVPA
jgi:DNA-binding response OmpR family regulator